MDDDEEDDLNGREKAAAQEARGTRPLVSELDSLRLLCGFSAVQVLTPLVETRLRSGLLPPRPLKLRVELGDGPADNDATHCVELVLRIGYPSVPVEADLLDLTSRPGSNKSGDSISCSGDIDGDGAGAMRGGLVAALQECLARGDGAVQLVRSMMAATKSLELAEGSLRQQQMTAVVHTELGTMECLELEGQRLEADAEGGALGADRSDVGHAYSSSGLGVPEHVLSRVEALASGVLQNETEEATGALPMGSFACRVCRHMLFSFDALHEHSLPLLRQLLSGISTASTGGSCSCTSLFLEEAPAGLDPSSGPRNDRYSPGISASTSASTGSSEDAVSDKLYCGKCAYRVGSWSWAGARCSCGQWVVPAFQFTSSKVDAKLA